MNDEVAQGAALPGGVSAGSRVAGYRLEEQIGQGGMAVVFRAHDERLERQVALKVLAPALAADESFRRRFIRESRSAAAVDHPHIIPVFDAGEADGVLFLAMRYVPGGEPGHWCAGGPAARGPGLRSSPRSPPPWMRRIPPGWCTGMSSRATYCWMPGRDRPGMRTCRISA